MATELTRVSSDEAKRLLDEDGYQWIDVRSAPEYAAGHPAGAHNVPLMRAGAGGLELNADFLAVMQALYPPDRKLIIGCAVGGRSLRAAKQLQAAGYTNVVDARAGVAGVKNAFGQVTEKGWVAHGYPMELTTAGGSYDERRAAAGLGR